MTRRLRQLNLVLGALLTGALAALAILGLLWTPYDPLAQDIAGRFSGPSAAHLLGQDHYGRDVLSMIMEGTRTSFLIGAGAVLFGLALGTPLGLAGAAVGGWADEGVSRFVDLVFAFPAVLTAILVTAIAGPGATNAVIAIGVFNSAVFARVVRGAARQVYGREFVRAAGALGRSQVDIALRHVLPNIAGLLIVQATIQFALAILAEAALSYLGLGTRPPHPSLGRMLFDSQTFMFSHPLQAVFPGCAIALAVLGLNLLGDGLRDALDPRLGRRVVRVG